MIPAGHEAAAPGAGPAPASPHREALLETLAAIVIWGHAEEATLLGPVEHLFGHPRAQWQAVAGGPAAFLSALVHPDDREARTRAQGTGAPAEYRVRREDGRYVWVRELAAGTDRAAPVTLVLEVGRGVGADGGRDWAGAWSSVVLDAIASGVIVTDAGGRVLRANAVALGLLGLGPEAVGAPLAPLVPEAAALLTAPPRRRLSLDLGGADGRRRLLGFTNVPIPGPDGGAVLTLFRDIGQLQVVEERRRRAEQLAQVGEMAARLTHELKNPLATLLAGLQMLDDALPPLQGAVVRDLADEVRRMAALLHDFLRSARPTRLAPVLVDLGPQVRDATARLVVLAESHGVELSISGTASAPVAVDPAGLGRVITNLVMNAIDAVGAGGRVWVSWGLLDGPEIAARFPTFDGQVAWLEVRDDGPGIPPERLECIFRPFYTTKSAGTGLGLALTREIVEAHGGVLQVLPTVGRGATFRATFVAGKRPPCWGRPHSCAASCCSCPVQCESAGLCCWMLTGQALYAEFGRWPDTCLECQVFRDSNLLPHVARDMAPPAALPRPNCDAGGRS